MAAFMERVTPKRGERTRSEILSYYITEKIISPFALAELEAAQSEYDRILSKQASKDVVEARARLTAARKRYEAARDRWLGLLTVDQALRVQTAISSKTSGKFP